jgi:hypothetical protein
MAVAACAVLLALSVGGCGSSKSLDSQVSAATAKAGASAATGATFKTGSNKKHKRKHHKRGATGATAAVKKQTKVPVSRSHRQTTNGTLVSAYTACLNWVLAQKNGPVKAAGMLQCKESYKIAKLAQRKGGSYPGARASCDAFAKKIKDKFARAQIRFGCRKIPK